MAEGVENEVAPVEWIATWSNWTPCQRRVKNWIWSTGITLKIVIACGREKWRDCNLIFGTEGGATRLQNEKPVWTSMQFENSFQLVIAIWSNHFLTCLAFISHRCHCHKQSGKAQGPFRTCLLVYMWYMVEHCTRRLFSHVPAVHLTHRCHHQGCRLHTRLLLAGTIKCIFRCCNPF